MALQFVGGDNGTGATTLVIALDNPCVAGDTLSIRFFSSSNVTPTATDDKSQTYTRKSAIGKLHELIFENSVAGAQTITVTLGGTFDAAGIASAEPLLTPSSFDLITNSGTAKTATAATWTTDASGARAQASEVAYAFVGSFTGSGQFPNTGLPSGWAAVTGTGITNGARDGGSSTCFFMARKTYAATTSDSGGGDCLNASTNWFSLYSAYKQAALVLEDTLHRPSMMAILAQ